MHTLMLHDCCYGDCMSMLRLYLCILHSYMHLNVHVIHASYLLKVAQLRSAPELRILVFSLVLACLQVVPML